MMRSRSIVGILVCAGAAALAGAPPKGFELDSSALSPNGSIRIEHYANRADARLANHLQIRVADARDPTNRALLYAHDRGEFGLDPWFAIYDLRTRRLHFDLRLANDADVERVKRAPPAVPKPAARRPPVALGDPGREDAARRLGLQALSWQEFLLHGPPGIGGAA